MKKIFSAVLLIASVFAITSCSTSSKVQKADTLVKSGKYADASDIYKAAYAKESNKITKAEIAVKVGDCYKKMSNPKESVGWYEKAVKGGNKDPKATLAYADALKMNGRYDEAIAQYNAYKQMNPTDPRGQDGATQSEMAQQWKDKPTKHKVENVSALNTKYFDFAVTMSKLNKNSLYFSSSRAEANGTSNDAWYGEKYFDLFQSTQDNNGKWSTPTPLPAPVNSGASEGAATFDSKGNVMYFTRCEEAEGKTDMPCKIFKSTMDGTSWSKPEALPFCNDDSHTGHPALSADGLTMYFSSDMEGGQGGKDIWMSKFENGAWGAPVNAGSAINTEGDEMYPYIAANGKLYFSSNGQPGMGGLDIFSASNESGSWGNVTNLHSPINSSADDFGIVFTDETTGYFTSSREGGQGSDDIYSFVMPPANFAVYGRVYDTETKANIAGATVELFGSDGTSLSVKTEDAGTYRYPLKPNVKYKVSASFTGYLTKFEELSTVGMDESKDFEVNFDFPLQSTSHPIVLPEIYYDYDKATLRAESKKELDGLIKTLNDNPTITIKLTSHCDFRGTDAYNDKLSNNRAKSVVDYLISHNIAKDRLSSEGKGKRDPRTLTTDNGSFKKGDKLTDDFINKQSTKALKEEAHQLNRRTQFEVLRTDYIPKK